MSARIMVVEDERIVALDLKGGLESLGYEVVDIAARGEDAIERAPGLKPDLILMDINLDGEIDGTEAARHLREQFNLPVVFLTAFGSEQTLQRAEISKPYGYLLKPFELRELGATIRMVLARRAVEKEVEQSEERLRMAVEAASLGVLEWCREGSSTTESYHLSRTMEQLLGPASALINEGRDAFIDRIHPEDRAAICAAFEENTQINMNVRMRFSSQREGWVEIFAQAYRHEASKHERIVGVIRDITHRKRREEQLRQADVVFRSAAEGIIIMGLDKRIVAVNPAFTQLTGYTSEEVVGRDPADFLDARRQHDRAYPDLDAGLQSYWQGEVAYRRASGDVFPTLQHVCAVQDSSEQITHYVITFSDISSIRRAESQIRHMAYHDTLTGLGNRNALDEILDSEIARHASLNQRLALMFVDLDGFKIINDTLGHASGDHLLQVIAERIHDSLRHNDVAIRLGGDEFVVLITEVEDPQDCAVVAEKLLSRIRRSVDLPHESICVSASIGIATYPGDGTTRHSLVKAADCAMYEAKSRGRNRYAFYTPEMAARTRERMLIEQGLLHAVDNNDLIVHYQPVVDLRDGSLVGMEALMRWQHPQLGFLPPDRFISIAEDSGKIESLGEWIMEAACLQTSRWIAEHGTPLRIAVNVSVREMSSERFIERIETILRKTGLAPEYLELEITESTLQTIEYSQGLLYRLKALGVRIAIDDFGTGFSSLGLLKHLPIDRIKIDRSFVRDLPDDSSDVAITRAIIGLAHSMDIEITAEGIENAAQQAFLRELGCEHGQGYLFSRPVSSEEFTALIARKIAPH